MKSKLILCSFLAVSFLNAQAAVKNMSPIKIVPKVIYGNDDRLDVYESSDSLMRELSRSTAAQILNNNITLEGDVYTVKSKTLADEGICKSERFSNQMAAANCSGFLVSADTLVTAGHCINTVSDCANHSWVFDFANTSEEKTSFTFTKDQVFHCTKIIAREKNSETMNDYSVLKLDRPVLGRAPLKFRTNGKTADDAVFTVIGHPSGLPTKITAAADMRDNTNLVFFRTNADTYGGNSGSAVVDSRTGVVEGILVRGDQDYAQAEGDSCLVSVHRDQNGGRGEDVTRITNIKVLLKN
ncbi:MAG: trypsin-like peptidase domain-containing protein [Bacteriovorax sp.]|nr:trypsin-like peptidase domain-containing protein [Bacteriovorax sp.]